MRRSYCAVSRLQPLSLQILVPPFSPLDHAQVDIIARHAHMNSDLLCQELTKSSNHPKAIAPLRLALRQQVTIHLPFILSIVPSPGNSLLPSRFRPSTGDSRRELTEMFRLRTSATFEIYSLLRHLHSIRSLYFPAQSIPHSSQVNSPDTIPRRSTAARTIAAQAHEERYPPTVRRNSRRVIALTHPSSRFKYREKQKGPPHAIPAAPRNPTRNFLSAHSQLTRRSGSNLLAPSSSTPSTRNHFAEALEPLNDDDEDVCEDDEKEGEDAGWDCFLDNDSDNDEVDYDMD
ncbi:hypothetical protein C8J57DRAFT_1537892 [Mycena rebaudengoi]|nr:hypothetical protein C8J57DRAFT_1537892 [Mycena rebaudengoi]